MLCKTHTLEVSDGEFDVIEAALHTQSKILHVQAGAGTPEALDRLNEVKRVLSKIDQRQPEAEKSGFCLPRVSFFFSRIFG